MTTTQKTDSLCDILDIKYPIIMAPMFLVSNADMLVEAINSGITGCVPALNYRTDTKFREAITSIRERTNGSIGINLIVNKSNIKFKQQIQTCVDLKVDYIITSLGSPEQTIKICKPHGIKVFCDVVDVKYAKKVEALGCDAIIAVNNEAGGHCGPTPASILIPELVAACSIPVISAGGVSNGKQMREMIDLGACGISMGSPFIATTEAGVSKEYKQAIVDYGAKDIVLSEKLSGSPCTVINTPYVQKTGTKRNFIETLLSKNKKLKKFMKMLTFYKGTKALEKAAFSTTYDTVWCAGPSIEGVNAIKPVKKVVSELIEQFENA
ncbi:MAG: nitronate monooxygenase [Flavobacteriales bacterium]|jgi:nitronate monooxygenase|tara:strand:- start:909 stop:1880 length:972 start_codon:yes stop_codon:yes gene_type:complete